MLATDLSTGLPRLPGDVERRAIAAVEAFVRHRHSGDDAGGLHAIGRWANTAKSAGIREAGLWEASTFASWRLRRANLYLSKSHLAMKSVCR